MTTSRAQKDAIKRWELKNPATTVRTPQHIHDALKQAAKELEISHHSLINSILAEWLESKN